MFIFSLWFCRLEKVNNKDRDEISVSGIDDVIMILKSDYENAYFVTGIYLLIEFYTDCLVASWFPLSVEWSLHFGNQDKNWVMAFSCS